MKPLAMIYDRKSRHVQKKHRTRKPNWEPRQMKSANSRRTAKLAMVGLLSASAALLSQRGAAFDYSYWPDLYYSEQWGSFAYGVCRMTSYPWEAIPALPEQGGMLVTMKINWCGIMGSTGEGYGSSDPGLPTIFGTTIHAYTTVIPAACGVYMVGGEFYSNHSLGGGGSWQEADYWSLCS